jgi:hypothetical protein
MIRNSAFPLERSAKGKLAALLLALTVLLTLAASRAEAQTFGCSPPAVNAIVCENSKAGAPSSQWDISGAGDMSIQGFATDISVNQGQTVHFKVNTTAASYRIDIYRLGYYGGLGARNVATIQPSALLPQSQPACIGDAATGLIDCGNWAESASWTVPVNATSGVYIAKLVRSDTGGASHIVFIVRADSGNSQILFQTSDTTWQAYNAYGGNSLYAGSPASRAYKVSYNRPFIDRANINGYCTRCFLFNAEYPMIRWLEANGYDVSYTTGLDSDRNGSLITSHQIFLTVGHDEYWSGGQRANVQAAVAAGVNMAFFDGNQSFWKTRWENSIDGSNTPYRTLVCYKETHANQPIDPADPPTWTGAWRDSRFSPPGDGGRPENALFGQLFMVDGPRYDAITVPSAYSALRFWRNTAIAKLTPGSTYTMPVGTLGHEWDEDVDNGFRPAGVFDLSSTTLDVSPNYLLDYGTLYGSGMATHSLTMYRASSGALVFAAGTIQWSWGLDVNHDLASLGASAPDVNMQQATVNLLADMGAQPGTLQPGLIAATASADKIAPSSSITAPAAGAAVQSNTPVTISGTATDAGVGVVAAVEVSTDGGTTWHRATGLGNWSYVWFPGATASAVITSRAVDDSANLEVPSAGTTVTVVQGPLTIWPATATPKVVSAGGSTAVELGVKFTADLNGVVNGVRFYKGPTNTGTHVANLWTASGVLLATTTFTNETGTGWQQADFATPVAIQANTTYIASYHTNTGGFSYDLNYFATGGYDSPPLHALSSASSGGNGVYLYSAASGFPNQSYQGTNYWVDVVFTPAAQPISVTVSPSTANVPTGSTRQFTATVQNTTNTNVTWQVNGVTGGDAAHGTISAAGLYTAPGSIPNPATVTVTAISQADTTKSGSASVTVVLPTPPPTISAVQSSSVTNTTATITWTTDQASDSQVDYGTTASYGTSTPLNATLVTSHSVQLSGLQAGILYHYRVDSRNASGELSSSSDFTFTTTNIVFNTIWSSTAAPVNVANNDPSAVEVGLKFQSDVSGYVTGVRFYKSSSNTGTHIGNLWSSTGALLATGTFTGETASGWQQLNFTAQAPIAANAVYVVSYHTNTGFYSADLNYFAAASFNNPPLHALSSPASGGNGVYLYTAASAFPTQTYSGANYWVDVVFTPAALPVSISVSPTSASVPAGATQQFTATVQNTTNTNVTWQVNGVTGGDSAHGTISAAGLYTAPSTVPSPPAVTVTAISQADTTKSASAAVTVVQPLPPPVIGGVQASAIGNTTAYIVWTTDQASDSQVDYGLTVSYGTSSAFDSTLVTAHTVLLTGLSPATLYHYRVKSRNSSGALATSSDFTFTTPSAAPNSIWSSTAAPNNIANSDPSAVELGLKFRSDVAGHVIGVRFYKSSSNTGTHIGNLWTAGGALLATGTFTSETPSGWQQMYFAAPVAIAANTIYVVSYHTNVGFYSADGNYFASSVDNAPLHAPSSGSSGGNGVYLYGASGFPNLTYSSENYWVDVIFVAN